MLAHEAMPAPPPPPKPNDPTEAKGGGGTRNGIPLYDFPAKRISAIIWRWKRRCGPRRCAASARCRTSSQWNVSWTNWRNGPAPIRSRSGWRMLSDPRARRCWRTWRRVAIGHRAARGRRAAGSASPGLVTKTAAAYAAVAVEVEVDQEVRCAALVAADAGLVINPDGAANSWRADHPRRQHDPEGAGEAGRRRHHVAGLGQLSDSEFSEVPEISTVIIHAPNEPTLGMGECTFGPTAAAIGNAVSARARRADQGYAVDAGTDRGGDIGWLRWATK